MPTPMAHSLFGLSMGLAWTLPRGLGPRALWRAVVEHRPPIFLMVILANLPDLDYLPGVIAGEINRFHHFAAHSLGGCLGAAAVAGMAGRLFRPGNSWRLAGFVFLALSSHLALDLFCDDRTPPVGIMALWPLTDQRFLSPAPLFPRIYKATWSEVFQWRNAAAVLIEFAILLPAVVGVLVYKRFAPAVPPALELENEPEMGG